MTGTSGATLLLSSEQYPALGHSLVALALGDEGLETNEPKLRDLSMAEARKAVAAINRYDTTLPRTVLLAFAIIVTQLSALINRHTFRPCLRMLPTLLDADAEDEYDLAALIRQMLAYQCQQIDPLVSLRNASIPASQPPTAALFTSLQEARHILGHILLASAYQVKQGSPLDHRPLLTWLHHFNLLLTPTNTTA